MKVLKINNKKIKTNYVLLVYEAHVRKQHENGINF